MLANGLASMLGCLMGNPFPVTVYVGHPGWKAMGASIGYTGVRRDHVHRAAVRAGGLYARHHTDDRHRADSGVYRRRHRQPW